MEEKKDFVVSVRMNESMYNIYKKHADEEVRSLSQYIYLILLEECMNRGEIVQPMYIK